MPQKIIGTFTVVDYKGEGYGFIKVRELGPQAALVDNRDIHLRADKITAINPIPASLNGLLVTDIEVVKTQRGFTVVTCRLVEKLTDWKLHSTLCAVYELHVTGTDVHGTLHTLSYSASALWSLRPVLNFAILNKLKIQGLQDELVKQIISMTSTATRK